MMKPKPNSLCSEAGYSTSNPLKLTLTYANTYGTELGDQLKSQLAAIGIDLSINYVEFSTWLQNVHANGDYELSLVDHAESHDFYKWTTPEYYYHYDGKQRAGALRQGAREATDEEESNEIPQAGGEGRKRGRAGGLAVRLPRDGGRRQARAGLPQQAQPDGAAVVADLQGNNDTRNGMIHAIRGQAAGCCSWRR